MVPELEVFHTPPEPTATYHSFSFDGLIAISAILPDLNAGPTLLNLSPENIELLSVLSVLFF